MKYTCIVVEDEALIRRSIAKKVAAANPDFQVVLEASDGREALDYFRAHKADLVITDIQMPIMDGLTLCRHLRALSSDTKILVISGYDEFRYAQQAIKYQICDYLLKPIDSSVLEETLNGIEVSLDRLHPAPAQPQPDAAPDDGLVQQVKSYLEQNFREDITINGLAEHFHFTASYLGKIYKAATNYTPLQYLIYLRINEAKRLLTECPQKSVAEIGKEVGYADPYYFSRIFKKQTGIAPTSYIH